MPHPTYRELAKRFPLIPRLTALEEVTWCNPRMAPAAEALADAGIDRDEVADAERRLQRFAPWLAFAFPETAATGGILESPLVRIPAMQRWLGDSGRAPVSGSLWLKQDSHLPVSGSIKSRGGIYAVLVHAEALALRAGLLVAAQDYGVLASARLRNFFSSHTLSVGSTGNLGLAVGSVGARLGFRVIVHMSADARAWKKCRLRELGVNVVEHAGDYGSAVAEARAEAQADPANCFIDDENSRTLFLGYAVAGPRLRQQCVAQGIRVDAAHPLLVYLPCGVGGAPGGVTFGLKLAFGDAVHCVLSEPTHSPSMLLGLATGLHAAIAVTDIGIDNRTAADGLAVGRPSGFAARALARLIDGAYTVSDSTLYRLLGALHATEGINLEPSALAGMPGPQRFAECATAPAVPHLSSAQMASATQIVWATGGGMVPTAEAHRYLEAAREAQ